MRLGTLHAACICHLVVHVEILTFIYVYCYCKYIAIVKVIPEDSSAAQAGETDDPRVTLCCTESD
jgi:hypothetical protein